MLEEPSIFLGKGETPQELVLRLANRHGLIAGATGTGKTVTLQILAEGFSDAGVPVFVADVKGDLSGISQAGKTNRKLDKRAETIGLDPYEMGGKPAIFWDLFGRTGHPIRTTVSEMGPLLLARLLDLNATQEGVLNIAFKVADDEGLLVLDFKDLRALLAFVAEHAKEIKTTYGNVSSASIGAIQRALLTLEQQGGDGFFGEPALELADMMLTDEDGAGFINVLDAKKLMERPRVYATFLLWLLAELFEELPEVGDPEKPVLVFFFDEAHLLFDDAPKALLQKIEMVVRLVRSKGVGVYFVTQNPLDVPDSVLGQLGNRVQHALRAFTPRDQKAVRVAAQTFRQNPNLDTAQAITELGVGEALVSTLGGKKGIPSIVERTLIRPPGSRMGPIKRTERAAVIGLSPLAGKYDDTIDRDSAYETLHGRAEEALRAEEERRAEEQRQREEEQRRRSRWDRENQRGYDYEPVRKTRRSKSTRRRSSRRQSVGETFAKSVARSVGSAVGRSIIRGVLGSILRGR